MFARLKRLLTAKSNDVQDYRWGSTDALLRHAFGGTVSLDATAALNLYRESSAVATAVDFVASKIEAVEPVIRHRSGEMTDDSPVLDFLRSPNGYQDWHGFIGAASRFSLVTGNAYFHAIGNTRSEPVEIYAPHPGTVGPFESGLDDLPDRYQLTRRQDSQLFTLDKTRRRQGFGYRYYSGALQELFPVLGFRSGLHTDRGDSPLEAIILEIQQHIKGRRHNNALLENGARPSSVWYIKNTVSEPLFKIIEKTIREKYTGTNNAGQAVVIQGGDMDFKDMIVNNKDMDFVLMDRAAKEAIAARYRIPIPLITADRQTFNNYDTAIEALYDDAVIPVVEHLYRALSRMLMPRFGIDPADQMLAVDLNQITALRSRFWNEVEKRTKIGVETMNEIRLLIPGRDPIEGGDAVFASASSVPIAGNVPEPEPIDPDLDPNAAAQDDLDEAA